MHLQADVAKLKTDAGWAPATPLEEGLRRTIEWHRARADRPSEPQGPSGRNPN
jgi:nucleoside-diphosphate-sugar epimerase